MAKAAKETTKKKRTPDKDFLPEGGKREHQKLKPYLVLEYLMKETVRYKKYFYALRPLLAAIYIERYHCAPPVFFDDLLRMDLPDELRQAIDKLLTIKKLTTEAEELPHIPAIMDFIHAETAKQKETAAAMQDDRKKDFSALNEVFRRTIRK